MTGDRVFHNVKGLRDPERLALLETERVTSICLGGLSVRTVLDVGTGSGVFAEAFARRGLEVTGVDVQEAMLEAARGCVPGVRFELAPSERLPFRDGAFDLVFLGHVLHEARDPLQSLREAGRVSALRVAVLEWPYLKETLGPPLRHRLKVDDIRGLASSAGFTRVESPPLSHMALFLMAK
jgi:ubiquinone/menaquinone biosynthesis C-methylase UbiE